MWYDLILTTRKEMSRINRLVEIIQKNKKISRVDLIMASGISISYFDKLKPFMLSIYQEQIRYENGTFESIKTVKAVSWKLALGLNAAFIKHLMFIGTSM